jgi:hypothetical protein
MKAALVSKKYGLPFSVVVVAVCSIAALVIMYSIRSKTVDTSNYLDDPLTAARFDVNDLLSDQATSVEQYRIAEAGFRDLLAKQTDQANIIDAYGLIASACEGAKDYICLFDSYDKIYELDTSSYTNCTQRASAAELAQKDTSFIQMAYRSCIDLLAKTVDSSDPDQKAVIDNLEMYIKKYE